MSQGRVGMWVEWDGEKVFHHVGSFASPLEVAAALQALARGTTETLIAQAIAAMVDSERGPSPS